MNGNLDYGSPIPLYLQIEQYLRLLIREPDYSDGKLLPGEVELANRFGVSRNTVRAAIDKLVQENLISRKKGVGTVVVKKRIVAKLERWSSFTEEMEAQGIRMQTLFQQVKWVEAEDEIAEELGVSSGTRVCRLERLKGVDGEPVVWFVSYFPPRVPIAPGETFEGHLYDILENKYHCIPQISNEEIGALPCNGELSQKLAVDPDAPVLVRKRFVLNAAEKLLELCYSYYRSDKFVYHVQIHRGAKAAAEPMSMEGIIGERQP